VSLLEKCQHVKDAQISQYVHQVQQKDLIQVVVSFRISYLVKVWNWVLIPYHVAEGSLIKMIKNENNFTV
jgi:hypothetical protein